MGYNKENFKRVRAEYQTKALRAEAEADARRAELYLAIPSLKAMDDRLSAFGLRIMATALKNQDTAGDIARLRAENEAITAARAELLRKHGYPADYSNPHYECDKCRDSGYVGINMCSCMRRSLIEAGMAASGLSELMKRQSFENFKLDYYKNDPKALAAMQHHFDFLRQYASTFALSDSAPIPESLLFLGGTGLGKTHLSTSIARTVIERGYDVFYNSAVGMFSDFEFKRFGSSLAQTDGDNTARYTECDLLIIDDLGSEVNNQFTLSCLYHVINTRLNLQKPTIVSTNISSVDGLRKTYDDRIASRFAGEFRILPFYGTDVRKQKISN